MTAVAPPAANHPRRVQFRYAALPKYEMWLCYAVSFFTMVYAWFGVYQASKNYKWKIGDFGKYNDLPIIGGRIKDETNWEWTRWSPSTFSYLPVYFFHAIFFNIGSKYITEKIFIPIYTLYSISACAYFYSPFLVMVSIIQGTFIFVITNMRRATTTVWLTTLPLLYLMMHYTHLLSDEPFHVFTYLSYTFLSYISFNLETVDGPVRKEDDTLLKRYIRMLFYAYYQPYLVSLIVLYPDFERQMANRTVKARNWKNIASRAVRLVFWWSLMDIALHFLYFDAVLRDQQYSFNLPKDQFVALGMALGIAFHVKYTIIFGLPSLFAAIDNMEPLAGPICIVRVTLYSKVWREFDRGLYQFFKKYLFVPICAPLFTLPRKIFGVLVSYSFVLLWHGFYHHNVIWIGLNILALFIEMTAKALYTIDGFRNFIDNSLSPTNLRRVLAWLQILPFALGLYSNFYFLGGSAVGGAFVQRFLIEETVTLRWPFFFIITLGYFNSHSCMEADRLKQVAADAEAKEKAKKSK